MLTPSCWNLKGNQKRLLEHGLLIFGSTLIAGYQNSLFSKFIVERYIRTLWRRRISTSPTYHKRFLSLMSAYTLTLLVLERQVINSDEKGNHVFFKCTCRGLQRVVSLQRRPSAYSGHVCSLCLKSKSAKGEHSNTGCPNINLTLKAPPFLSL